MRNEFLSTKAQQAFTARLPIAGEGCPLNSEVQSHHLEQIESRKPNGGLYPATVSRAMSALKYSTVRNNPSSRGVLGTQSS